MKKKTSAVTSGDARPKNENLLRTASFMAIATLLAKVCGLVRESLIAAYFSTGFEGNAYMVATQLPMTLFDIVIGGVITTSFIPIFNDVLQKRSREDALRFANRFIGIIFTICTAIAVLGIVFADQLIAFMAPEFGVESHKLAVGLSRIMFPMILFTGLAFCFVGILQSFGEFTIPAIMSLLSNLCVILYFPLFGKRFGIYGLAYAMLFSWSIQVFVQIPSLVRFRFRFRPRLTLRDPDILRALRLAGPMLVSTWVQPLYSIVNTRLASGLEGGVAALNYANRLYIVITGVFSFVVTNLVFPKLSRASSSDDSRESDKLIASSLKAVVLVIAPILVCFALLAEPIITVIYERGAFSAADTKVVAGALTCYSFGMLGLAVNEVLSKAFFSRKNSKTPMLTALCSMLVNIVLAYLLTPMLGVRGLALAGAGGSTANAILNGIFLHRSSGKLFEKRDRRDFAKIALAAILAIIPIALIDRVGSALLPHGTLSALFVGGLAGVCGLLVYALVLLLTKESDLTALLTSLTHRKETTADTQTPALSDADSEKRDTANHSDADEEDSSSEPCEPSPHEKSDQIDTKGGNTHESFGQ